MRADDLNTLGLTSEDVNAEDSQRRIRRAFMCLSKKHHRDKGGEKEAFQELSAAYERLKHACNAEAKEEECADADEEGSYEGGSNAEDESVPEYDCYDDYFNFFRYHGFYDDEYDDGYFETFAFWEQSREQRRKEWSERHRQELRQNRDFRDAAVRVNESTEMCMFCGEKPAITERQALLSGVNWDEYIASTSVNGYPRYVTCWCCKTNHKSVLTKNMACKKFAKKLDVTVASQRSGREYNPIFWSLKCDKRSFHHQPVTNMTDQPTNNSEYYWYPDLEREALARGWKPRGEMKNQVPWKRKDSPRVRALVATKHKKRAQEEKQSAKRKSKIPDTINSTLDQPRRVAVTPSSTKRIKQYAEDGKQSRADMNKSSSIIRRLSYDH